MLMNQCRDVLLSVTGMENVRILSNRDCETSPLTECDWLDESIPLMYGSVLSPISERQKQYMIENSKLAAIGISSTPVIEEGTN
jgi:hypothetical protein